MIDTLTGALGLGAHEGTFWIPLVLMLLLYLTAAAGVVLGGFDIGVGCLLLFAPQHLRLRMLALLSPWQDANGFWLFLGLGLLVAAFPQAWGTIMGALYLPLSLLGAGVLLRSASFELRLRSPAEWQAAWVITFACGSWLVAISHGLILARVVTSYANGLPYSLLGVFFAACGLAAYSLLGATWLIMREAGELRVRSAVWAQRNLRRTAAGLVAVSVALVLANSGVFLKWGEASNWWRTASLWVVLLVCFVSLEMMLQRLVHQSLRITLVPFVLVVLMFLAMLGGVFYSFFPYLVLDNITIWDAAASTPSLRLVLTMAALLIPVAIIFNVWVYWSLLGVSRPPQPPRFSG